MNTIHSMQKNEIESFYPIFTNSLNTQFPGYSKSVITYLLSEIYTVSNFSYWIEKELKTILLSTDNNTISGFAVIDAPYGGVSLLRWLGVKDEYQHKGIGTQLIHSWEEHARSQGSHKMEVASQPEAKEFYAKAGLTLEGLRKQSYFGIDQYLYGKVISTPTDRVMVGY